MPRPAAATLSLKAQQWRQGLWLLGSLRRRALEPAACKAPWQVAQEQLKELQRQGVRRSVKTKGLGSWVALLGELLQLRLSNLEPDVVSYGLLLREAPGWRKALTVLRELQGAQLRSNVVLVDATLQLLGARNWPRSLLALHTLAAQGVAADKSLADQVLRATAGATQWRKALWLRWHKADGRTWCALMSSWQSTQLFLEARRSGVELDLQMVSASVATWPHAAELLRCSQDALLRSDTTMLAAVQGSGVKASGWREALSLNVKAKQMDLELDVLGLPHWESSLHRFGALTERQLRLHDAMSNCPWRLSLSLLFSSLSWRLQRSVMALNCVLAACGKAREWPQAVQHFAALQVSRLKPDDVSFNSLLGALERTGKWQLALALLERMASGQLALDEFSYNAAINVCKYGVRRASARKGSFLTACRSQASLSHLKLMVKI